METETRTAVFVPRLDVERGMLGRLGDLVVRVNAGERDPSVWDRLDLLDLEYPQVGESAMESKQRVVVGTQAFR